MRPEGRAIAVAELLRQGYTAQQVSKSLKIADAGGTPQEAMAALREPDEPGYLDNVRQPRATQSEQSHTEEGKPNA